MRLIVTRPEPDAARTAQALIRLGHVVILSPMLDILPQLQTRFAQRRYQAVLATSRNAVRALAGHPQQDELKGLPLLAVGDGTALEAKRCGFSGARSAGGAVADLAALVTGELAPTEGPVLYAAGEDQAGDLAGRLTTLGFSVDEVVVYKAQARTRLSGVAAEALKAGEVDGILFFSRRSAEGFAAALRLEGLSPLGARVACFCLSASVAEAVAAISSGRVLIAEKPDQISLLMAVERASGGNL